MVLGKGSAGKITERAVPLICQGINRKIGGEFGVGGLFDSASDELRVAIYKKWNRIVLPALVRVVEKFGTGRLPNLDNSCGLPILHSFLMNKAPRYIVQDIIEYLGSTFSRDSTGRQSIDVAIECGYNWGNGAKEIVDAFVLVQRRSVVHICAEHGLKWESGMRNVLEDDIKKVEEQDKSSGLHSFMLAAMGSTHDVGSIFQLIKTRPDLVRKCGSSNNDINETAKKSVNKRKRIADSEELPLKRQK